MFFRPSQGPAGTAATVILDTVGDGSGTTPAIGNYAVTPQDFIFSPAAGKRFAVRRIHVTLSDNVNFAAGGYGGQAAPLTVGVIFSYKSAGIVYPPSIAFKTNFDYSVTATQTDLHNFSANDQILEVYFDIVAAGSGPLLLIGSNSDFVKFTLNDNFTFLLNQKFSVLGEYTDF